jgi:hypothetical protein
VKAEDNAKQKTKHFVFMVEAHPTFGRRPKVVKAEDNSKQKTRYFVFMVEAHPTFGHRPKV